MRYGKLRIAWSGAWGVMAVLLCALWVRSLNRIDRITWHYHNADAFQVGTIPGRVSFTAFVDDPFPLVANRTRPWMTKWFESMRLFNGKMQWWFEVWSDGTSRTVSIPDWFLIFVCCGLGATPWLRYRFSLHTLLIVTTLVAIALGLFAYTVNR
jgi:hypothetical protein